MLSSKCFQFLPLLVPLLILNLALPQKCLVVFLESYVSLVDDLQISWSLRSWGAKSTDFVYLGTNCAPCYTVLGVAGTE